MRNGVAALDRWRRDFIDLSKLTYSNRLGATTQTNRVTRPTDGAAADPQHATNSMIIAGAPTSFHDPVVLVHSLRAIVLPLHPSAWPEVQRVLVFLARDFVNNPG